MGHHSSNEELSEKLYLVELDQTTSNRSAHGVQRFGSVCRLRVRFSSALIWTLDKKD